MKITQHPSYLSMRGSLNSHGLRVYRRYLRRALKGKPLPVSYSVGLRGFKPPQGVVVEGSRRCGKSFARGLRP